MGQITGDNGTNAFTPDCSYGVFGQSVDGCGVVGNSINGIGVKGVSHAGVSAVAGVVGTGQNVGVKGDGGIFGIVGTGGNHGVYGTSNEEGVRGEGQFGVMGNGLQTSTGGAGVIGQSTGPTNINSFGVIGDGLNNTGLWGHSNKGLAGLFDGNVTVNGTLFKSGGGFRIDHPLDPANKYLSHSFVESPDMKNIYDGVAVLDSKGEAMVALPDWFEALNLDFRYQLTPIGAAGPNLHIAEEISNNRFKIAGGKRNMKVSWQVTGIRKDAWANAHRIKVEEDKLTDESGCFLHPQLHNVPEEKGIAHARLSMLMKLKNKRAYSQR